MRDFDCYFVSRQLQPVVMTAAQRQLHEQLRLRHAQLQQQILAQQEELRRVSEQLLLAQYGLWGSTYVKVIFFSFAVNSLQVSLLSGQHGIGQCECQSHLV